MNKTSLKAFAVQTSDNNNIIVVGDSVIDALSYLGTDVYNKVVSVQLMNAAAYVVEYSDKKQ